MARHGIPVVRSVRARIAAALAVLGIGTAVAFGVAAPADASAPAGYTSVMAKTWYPWATPTNAGNAVWPIKTGWHVQMRCWTTGKLENGTRKWFYVVEYSSPATSGYVPATTVSARTQTVVGHCAS